MTRFLVDFSLAVRTLARNRGFALAALATLALGIGANSAIFSLVSAVLFRPLPWPAEERLVAVWETDHNVNPNAFADPKRVAAMKKWLVVSRNFVRWEERQRVFEALAGFTPRDVTLTGGGEAERLLALAATPGFFELAGVKPQLGRVFPAAENQPGTDGVALLSHGLWKRRFGSDRNVLGSTIRVDGLPHTVIGVLPESFAVVLLNGTPDLIVPMEHVMRGRGERRFAVFHGAARLKPGVSLAQAQSEMDSMAAALEAETPRRNRGRGVMLVPLRREIAGEVKPALMVLLGAVACVLLIACANVANLLLARAAARRREMGVRAALGAGAWDLARQVFAESAVVSLAGGAAGVLLARWGVSVIVAFLPPGLMPNTGDVTLDWRVLLFALAVSLAAAALFGLAPAIQAVRWSGRGSLHEALMEGGGRSGARQSRRLRAALVISEVAVALVLLAGAGLLARSFVKLRGVDPGFRSANILTLHLPLAETRYKDKTQRAALADQLLERIRTLPPVESAAFTNSLPIAAGWTVSSGVLIEGRDDVDASVYLRTVTADYFRTLGMRLVKGREFSTSDTKTPAVIVNEAMVRRLWPDAPAGSREPLGRRIRFGGDWCEIVGVVSDIKFDGLAADTAAEAYLPFSENNVSALALVVRSRADGKLLAPAIRSIVQSVDRDQPIERIQSMEQVIRDSVARPRFQMLVVGAFAGLALLLAAIGIYGVISYSVARRVREIGVRIALGASRADVLRLVVGEACLLALAGIVIGLAGALAATRILSKFLFGVKPTDPGTFVAVSLLLLVVAAAAGFIPACRAGRVDPIAALKSE